MGPDAILFPMVDTAEEAKRAMDACVYPPAGKRGIGPMRALRYGLTEMKSYIAGAADSLVRLIQIETETAVGNLEEIVKTPYLDGIVIGPSDMSFSVGRGGEIRCPENIALIERTVSVCKHAGMPVGIWIGDTAEGDLRFWWDKGMDLLLCGNDFYLLSAAQKRLCDAARNAKKPVA
jgi:2-dehydro-3-deoxyglucarate aldolase/4-hydroxy-2-oxoheptanedioate aldolase